MGKFVDIKRLYLRNGKMNNASETDVIKPYIVHFALKSSISETQKLCGGQLPLAQGLLGRPLSIVAFQDFAEPFQFRVRSSAASVQLKRHALTIHQYLAASHFVGGHVLLAV